MISSRRSETLLPTDGLLIGELVGPFGIQGEVKLYPITDFPERLHRYRRLILALPDGSQREVRVRRARPHKNVWLLTLPDVTTPEQAEELRGAQVLVSKQLAEPLPEGHFYLHDVIGLRAQTADGEDLGTVTDILRSPAHDLYVVGDLMIPAVKEIIERIDPTERLLVIRSKDLLLDNEPLPSSPPPEDEGAPKRRRFRARSRTKAARPPDGTVVPQESSPDD